MKTVRTTTAAAIVRFLQAQYVRRDGVEHRLIHGVAGIFGHGNVTGLGQALEEFGGKSLPHYQPKNEQAGACGDRLRQDQAAPGTSRGARRPSGPARPTW
jgi:TPP-dependent trihydroxycyclohexane-1,2-dione (THcHDO) dehydratase